MRSEKRRADVSSADYQAGRDDEAAAARGALRARPDFLGGLRILAASDAQARNEMIWNCFRVALLRGVGECRALARTRIIAMDLQTLLALLVFLFPLAYSPGPGNGFFAALGARGGLSAAWPALVGYHVATFVITAAIGLGIGLAIVTDPEVARAMRIAGALYVAWLGLGFLRAACSADRSATGLGPASTARFRDGALILVLNPKAYLIIGLLFTQFLEPGAEQTGRVLALSLVFTLNNLVAFVAWTLAGVALAQVLARGASGRTVDAVFGACLIGVSVWMITG